jgi:hypothetical protein
MMGPLKIAHDRWAEAERAASNLTQGGEGPPSPAENLQPWERPPDPPHPPRADSLPMMDPLPPSAPHDKQRRDLDPPSSQNLWMHYPHPEWEFTDDSTDSHSTPPPPVASPSPRPTENLTEGNAEGTDHLSDGSLPTAISLTMRMVSPDNSTNDQEGTPLAPPAVADALSPSMPVRGGNPLLEEGEIPLSPKPEPDNELLPVSQPLPPTGNYDNGAPGVTTQDTTWVWHMTFEYLSADASNSPFGVGTAGARQHYLGQRQRGRRHLPHHQQSLIQNPDEWGWQMSPTTQFNLEIAPDADYPTAWPTFLVNRPPLQLDPAHFQVYPMDDYPDDMLLRDRELTVLDEKIRDWWGARLQAGRPIPSEVLLIAPRVAIRTAAEHRHALDTVAAFNYEFRSAFLQHQSNQHEISREANPYETLVPTTRLFPATFTRPEYEAFLRSETSLNSNGLPRDDLVRADQFQFDWRSFLNTTQEGPEYDHDVYEYLYEHDSHAPGQGGVDLGRQ